MYTVPKLDDFSTAALASAASELSAALDAETAGISSENEWKVLRDRWMARKNGILAQLNEQWLKAAPGATKRDVGQCVNELKKLVEEKIDATLARTSSSSTASRLGQERVDVTLPGNRRKLGVEHPLIRTKNEIVAVFKAMGYSIAEGPEVETDYYNFESLNFPPNHPARDTQDTLIVAGQQNKPLRDRLLLRTHTSPVQIRVMEKQAPPVRIIVPGKVHRADTADATHSPIFHQVEGLAVDTNISFCDLKGTLDCWAKQMFGSSVRTRFYPSFFPFTEPSADMQISCFKCGGSGKLDVGRCAMCKASGWIEILGSGMVDPKVFGFVGYDPKKYSGFAFGMGVERIAILKYGVEDIQLFYQGDVRFLEQFA